MLKTISLITALSSFSLLSHSLEPQCFENLPTKKQHFSTDQKKSLSNTQQEQLQDFFTQLIRRKRDGKSQGYYCKQQGPIDEQYEVEFRPQKTADNSYLLRVRLIADKRGNNNERIRYTISNGKLYLGPNDRSSEVMILALGKNKLKTLEKYRQRNANGSSIARETVRYYQLSTNGLTVDNLYYINGSLHAANYWQLR